MLSLSYTQQPREFGAEGGVEGQFTRKTTKLGCKEIVSAFEVGPQLGNQIMGNGPFDINRMIRK